MIAIPNMEKPQSCDECVKSLDIECSGDIRDCPIIEIVRCKDCKWFELDVWGELNGIPLIVAHEMCKFWGGGCKTNPNGFCSYGEPRGSEYVAKD